MHAELASVGLTVSPEAAYAGATVATKTAGVAQTAPRAKVLRETCVRSPEFIVPPRIVGSQPVTSGTLRIVVLLDDMGV